MEEEGVGGRSGKGEGGGLKGLAGKQSGGDKVNKREGEKERKECKT